jgi:hypothetical protein
MIVIDPGHGGSEPRGKSTPYGRRCDDGRWEKDVTLSLARAVTQRLSGPVRLTRSHDANLSLGERSDVARLCGADAFLSLHTDATEGARVWTHPRAGREAWALAQALESELGPLVPLVPRRDDVEMAVLAPERLGARTAGALLELVAPVNVDVLGAAIARALGGWRGGARRYGRVSAPHVTCEALRPRSGFPIFKAIGTEDPLGAISDAVDRGVTLLDATRAELEDARARVAGGAALPVLRDIVARSLRSRLLIDPDRPATYTGAGPDTLEIVIRWLGNCRRILDNDEILYTCLGREDGVDPPCSPGTFAFVQGCDSATGQCQSHIFLCRDWWHPSSTRARTSTTTPTINTRIPTGPPARSAARAHRTA